MILGAYVPGRDKIAEAEPTSPSHRGPLPAAASGKICFLHFIHFIHFLFLNPS